jgi:hypothetical protein
VPCCAVLSCTKRTWAVCLSAQSPQVVVACVRACLLGWCQTVYVLCWAWFGVAGCCLAVCMSAAQQRQCTLLISTCRWWAGGHLPSAGLFLRVGGDSLLSGGQGCMTPSTVSGRARLVGPTGACLLLLFVALQPANRRFKYSVVMREASSCVFVCGSSMCLCGAVKCRSPAQALWSSLRHQAHHAGLYCT